MKFRHAIVGYIIPALIVALAAMISLWLHNHPRQLSLNECSEVYRMYYKVEDWNVTYFKQFPVNDTMTIAVTVLTATDSASWDRLKGTFGKSGLQHPASREHVTFWCAPKNNYTQPMKSDALENDIVVLSEYHQTIEVFHLEDMQQITVLMGRLLNKIKQSNSI